MVSGVTNDKNSIYYDTTKIDPVLTFINNYDS